MNCHYDESLRFVVNPSTHARQHDFTGLLSNSAANNRGFSLELTLLIDGQKGRKIAKRRGLPVAALAGVLLAAKKSGFIDEVMPIVKSLGEIGYRMIQALTTEIAKLTGESGS
jgi:predicted nucleic acid-binding protein